MQQHNDQTALVIKYFLDHFSTDLFTHKRAPINKQEELADKYLTQVVEVFAVFDRLCRYELYFAEFLPPKESVITEAEAVEYHLRNYVQEFYILRERVRKIVQDLKNDLSFYNIENLEDVKKVLDHLAKNIDKNFKRINDELRREHVHNRSISDFDLVRSKFLGSILSGEMPIPSGVRFDMDKVKKQYNTILVPSKEKHTKQAVDNSIGLKRGKQFFAARFGHIFASLNGHDGSQFDMSAGL